MISFKRLTKILLVLLVLLSIGAVFYKVAPHGVIRCYGVRWSGLDNISSHVYVDPDMPESQRQKLLGSLADGKEQIAGLYGAYSADPVIIAGHTMDVMQAFGDNSYNRVGRTYLTAVATFIILGPDGVLSTDVLSHELAHAEFSARIGHRNRSKIPSWFDEGLAVQFDGRYLESEWRTRTDNGRTAPDLDQIGIIRHGDWLAYATAKHEVGRWLDVVGQEGFWALLEAIRSGDPFQETYQVIEQAYD